MKPMLETVKRVARKVGEGAGKAYDFTLHHVLDFGAFAGPIFLVGIGVVMLNAQASGKALQHPAPEALWWVAVTILIVGLIGLYNRGETNGRLMGQDHVTKLVIDGVKKVADRKIHVTLSDERTINIVDNRRVEELHLVGRKLSEIEEKVDAL